MNSREIIQLKAMIATLEEIEERLKEEIDTRREHQAEKDDWWHCCDDGRAYKSRTNLLVEQYGDIRQIRELLLQVRQV